jgi:hypothetical protein
MKSTLTLLIFIFVSFNASGKSLRDFNTLINEEVHEEIKKDEDKFRKPTSRAPASMPADPKRMIEEPKKIDKNVRQIGPNFW